MDWLVISSEQGRKGSSGNFTEHRQYGNLRPYFPQVCLQDRESKAEQTSSRAWGRAPFGGSPFPESRKGQLQRAVAGSPHTWEHPDLKAQQPRALCLGPREAGGTGCHPPRPSSCPEHSGSRPSLGKSRDGGVPCGNRTRGSLCTWTSTPGMGVSGTQALGGAGGGPEKVRRGWGSVSYTHLRAPRPY